LREVAFVVAIGRKAVMHCICPLMTQSGHQLVTAAPLPWG